ncbi:CRISP/Allergen/PR-1-like [Galleria mellonella]|uniref:CRISP/Allergen/PR-1-like n=1 Tax=Galleria mellonella TaxID=7137 RepID=A0A6J3C5W0_GALME|nr:CRISP/Allergen/PR-1-like [Galleria mellonella]
MYCIFYLVFTCFILRDVCSDNKNETDNLHDYCTHPDCSMKNQHTMCIAANKQSPRLYASGMTTWMRYQILLLHNRHRDNIAMGLEAGQPPAANMRKMYWDYELEEMAEVWARQCQKRHDECRNTIRFNVLQNMDVRPVLPRVTEAQLLTDVVGAWFSGARVLAPEHVWSFKQSNCSAPGGCNAHWYSAVAWASTWRMGCSQALCTAKKRSCVLFRKKRRFHNLYIHNHDKEASKENFTTTKTSTSSENILRRTRYMTSSEYLLFKDFATTKEAKVKESPLHRGIFEDANNFKKRKEPKIIAFTFCNYGPAGNIDGFPIYEAGATCTNCPQGTQCGDKTHRALCSVLGDPDSRQ